MLTLVLISILALALGAAASIAIAYYRAEAADFVRTTPAEISRHPERTSIADLAEISFSTPDESRVAGWYTPSRNRSAVILIHGTNAERSSLLFETRALAEAGYGVLALDLPGHGGSEGRSSWGIPERHAIGAAVHWLGARAEVDPRRIGGMGLSMGAYVLAQAAVINPRLRGVVLAGCPNDVVEQNWIASSKWGVLSQLPTYWALRASGMPLDMLPKNIVGDIAPRMVFIIGGEFDRTVPDYMARQLFARARDPKEMWIVPQARHVDYSRVAPEEYRARLVDFFQRALLL